jgi:hypothetical protein
MLQAARNRSGPVSPLEIAASIQRAVTDFVLRVCPAKATPISNVGGTAIGF